MTLNRPELPDTTELVDSGDLPPAPDAILRRQWINYPARQVLYWPAPDSVAAVLAQWTNQPENRRTVEAYVVGGWDAKSMPGYDDNNGGHAWWKAPAADGWEVEYRPGRMHALRSGIYTRGKQRLIVRMSASWFPGARTVDEVQKAYTELGNLMRSSAYFGPGIHPMGTPARTGQALLQRSLPEGRDYLPTPPDVQEVLHSIPQGRKECLIPDGERRRVRCVAVYDARWMYAACLRHLPALLGTVPLVHDDTPDFAGAYRPGFYRVRWRVPSDWRHIGLLAYRNPDTGKPSWPRTGRDMWEAWTTEPELRLALEHGWPVQIRERILYAHQGVNGSDWAATWASKLIAMRSQADAQLGNRHVSDAIRQMLIQTIGVWARRYSRSQHIMALGEEKPFPAGAVDVVPVYHTDRRGKQIHYLRTEYTVLRQLDPTHEPMMRPEASAMVWGRARARLNRYALTYFPPEALLWARSDAVAVDGESPYALAVPADAGVPGSFRVKAGGMRSWYDPVEVPHDENGWQELMGHSDAEPIDETDEEAE